MRIQKFHWLTLSLFMASLALLACGEESGTEAVDTPTMSEANTVFELGKCTDDRNGESVLVVDENVHYVCRERTWTKENQNPIPEQSSSSLFPFNLSSSSLESSSSARNDFRSTCTEDVLIDSRDGQSYKIISAYWGTWMRENLRYNPPDPGYDWSWCYNELEENCRYGRYYTFAAALDSINTGYGSKGDCVLNPDRCPCIGTGDTHCDEGLQIQGICPNGWHIPNRWDFMGLAHIWSYKDSCNFFSNMIGMSVQSDHVYFHEWDHRIYLWTTSFYRGDYFGLVDVNLHVSSNVPGMFATDHLPTPGATTYRDMGHAIRCIKDKPTD